MAAKKLQPSVHLVTQRHMSAMARCSSVEILGASCAWLSFEHFFFNRMIQNDMFHVFFVFWRCLAWFFLLRNHQHVSDCSCCWTCLDPWISIISYFEYRPVRVRITVVLVLTHRNVWSVDFGGISDLFCWGPWLSVLQMAKVLEMSPWEMGDHDLMQLA